MSVFVSCPWLSPGKMPLERGASAATGWEAFPGSPSYLMRIKGPSLIAPLMCSAQAIVPWLQRNISTCHILLLHSQAESPYLFHSSLWPRKDLSKKYTCNLILSLILFGRALKMGPSAYSGLQWVLMPLGSMMNLVEPLSWWLPVTGSKEGVSPDVSTWWPYLICSVSLSISPNPRLEVGPRVCQSALVAKVRPPRVNCISEPTGLP